MKILAIESESPSALPDQIQPYLKAEAIRVWDLYQKGIIREAYFHAGQHVVVLVLECDSVLDAQNMIQSLPLVEARLISFTLLPLIPYDGFARLFASTTDAL
jgi:hypothetical protein